MKRRIGRRERRRLYRIVREIYGLFNYGEWHVKYARIRYNYRLCEKEEIPLDRVGFYDLDTKLFWVDYRYDILDTLVHECLHVLYPDLAEYEICSLTKWVMNNMSRAQAKHVIEHVNHFLV